MFDWFYEFLYMISKTLFVIIDGLIMCANKLCGIDPVNFEGEETDFLSYLMFSDEIGFAFRIAVLLATILLALFTVFMIIRSVTKDKAEGTPGQIAVKSFKTLLTFFFVPLVMFAFMAVGNAFINALYSATTQTAAAPGTFLFSSFATEGGMDALAVEQFKNGALDYYNTDMVAANMDITEFPFIFSWIAGAVVMFGIGSAMLIFVDRVLSIVILYIAAPISISTSVLDDGARFKLWRDQFLSKFIMGYGMILAINIYALVCSLVMDSSFTFFGDNSFLNLIMKLLIIGGGAFTMQKAMALVGNLVSQGAGSNELRDNVSAGGLARMAKGIAGKALGAAGYLTGAKALKSVASDAAAMKSRDWGAKLLDMMGLGLSGGTSDKNGVKDPGGSSESQNNDKADYGFGQNKAKDAIENPGFSLSNWNGNDNANNNQAGQNKNDAVSNAIQNGGSLIAGNGGGQA